MSHPLVIGNLICFLLKRRKCSNCWAISEFLNIFVILFDFFSLVSPSLLLYFYNIPPVLSHPATVISFFLSWPLPVLLADMASINISWQPRAQSKKFIISHIALLCQTVKSLRIEVTEPWINFFLSKVFNSNNIKSTVSFPFFCLPSWILFM